MGVPSLGFAFFERLSGTYYVLTTPLEERALEIRIHAELANVIEFPLTRTFRLRGEVMADRLAKSASFDGDLSFKLIDQRRVPYVFRFRGDDGKRYEFCGQIEWTPTAPIHSFTTLAIGLFNEAREEIGRGTLHFDLRNDILDVLRSVRLHFGRP